VASNTASLVMGQLIRHGRVRRASIGVAAQPAAISRRVQVATGVDQASGVMLSAIETGGPADAAGLLIGDVVVALDGVRVIRNGRAREFEMTPRERRGS
jgi:S1-C subfamily serine protease